jgi:hypothetical protein
LPEEALESYLDEAATLLAVVLDAAQLLETRSQLAQKWAQFAREKDGIGHTRFFSEVDWLESKPLGYLETVVKGVRLLQGTTTESYEAYELSKLYNLLSNTATLAHKRKVFPNNEHDVQNVMHDYLDAFFPQYTPSVQIARPIRNFKPDAGVINLRAAIEFKFAAQASEVPTAIGGIFEDEGGYAGSADWTRFYCVLYQTEPFVTNERFQAVFEKTASENWTPILVTGSGSRQKRDDGTVTEKKDK